MSDEQFGTIREMRSELGAPCWTLYHGTSTYRLRGILREDTLRVSSTGDDQKVALTPVRPVAEYFARNAVFGDRHVFPVPSDEETHPVVLELDGDALIAEHYDLQRYSDPVWGEGQCDWENEIACWQDIESLGDVLLQIHEIADEPSSRDVKPPLLADSKENEQPFQSAKAPPADVPLAG